MNHMHDMMDDQSRSPGESFRPSEFTPFRTLMQNKQYVTDPSRLGTLI